MRHGLEILVDERDQELLCTGGDRRALEIAKNMKNKGESIDYIIEMTGLTVDDILQL